MSYILPDGNTITLGSERFRCPEALFRPELLGSEQLGIHELLFNSIMKTDMDLRRNFFGNIILSGDNTKFQGFAGRLDRELTQMVPSAVKLKIVSLDRNYGVWVGGSIMSSFSTFQQMWISSEEYEENGTAIVHRKCQ